MLNRVNLSNYNGRTLQISLNDGAFYSPILDKVRHQHGRAAIRSFQTELIIRLICAKRHLYKPIRSTIMIKISQEKHPS